MSFFKQPEKTWKRETAFFVLICLLSLMFLGVFYIQAIDVFKVAIIPFMSFIGLSFGLDSWAKQIQQKK